MGANSRNAAYVSFPPGVVLPYYADVEKAFVERISYTATSGGNDYQVDPSQFEIPLFLQNIVQTSAVVANRYQSVQLGLQTRFVEAIYSYASQPASTIFRYVYQAGGAGGSAVTNVGVPGIINGVSQSGFSPIALSPGDQIVISNNNSQTGDVFLSQVDYLRIVVPTKGEESSFAGWQQAIPAAQL